MEIVAILQPSLCAGLTELFSCLLAHRLSQKMWSENSLPQIRHQSALENSFALCRHHTLSPYEQNSLCRRRKRDQVCIFKSTVILSQSCRSRKASGRPKVSSVNQHPELIVWTKQNKCEVCNMEIKANRCRAEKSGPDHLFIVPAIFSYDIRPCLTYTTNFACIILKTPDTVHPFRSDIVSSHV